MGVVAALNAEAGTLGPALPRGDGLSALGDGALLAVSGMGGAPAAAASRRLIDAGAAALMSFGFAGGLDPALGAGWIVLPAEIVSRSGARHPTSPDWCGRIRSALGARRPIASGLLLSGGEPIVSAADKAAAFRASSAIAVDMESFAVAEAACSASIPFIAVRVICDTAEDSLPRAVVAASRTGRINLLRLVSGLAAAPWEILGLLRLARRYRAAMRSLTLAARVRTE